MAITGSQVAAKARIIWQDEGGTRWGDAECLYWINETRREIARIKPIVFGGGTELTHALTSGAKQRITTTDAYSVASVDYNVTSGKSIRPTTRQLMDAFKPAWRNDTGSDVNNWFPDETDPLAFWIHPVATGDIKVHAHIAPADLNSLASTALPFDIYEPALVYGVVAKGFAKEDEAAVLAKAQGFAQLFTAALA